MNKERLTPEQLMKPRYKATGNGDYHYPDSPFNVNDVYELDKIDKGKPSSYWQYQYVRHDGVYTMYESEFQEYPHLFRKLEWWQDRKPEEMPEYVKCLGIVRKFKQWHNQESQRVELYDYPGEIDYEEFVSKEARDRGYEIFDINDCTPATEQEYLSFTNKTERYGKV